MLHTLVCSDNIALFHTSSSHSSSSSILSGMSCGTQERLIIQRPPPSDAFSFFDWSDFPVIQQEEYIHDGNYYQQKQQNQMKSLPERNEVFCTEAVTPTYDRRLFSLSSSSTTASASSSCSSLESLSCASASSELSRAKKQNNNKKHVTFADTVKVRVHSIVLGEHPCCKALALELGWEYNDEEINTDDRNSDAVNEEVMDEASAAFESMKLQNLQRRPYSQSNGISVRRRTYLERKRILKEVAGMTDEEIKSIVGERLRSVTVSSRSLNSLAAEV